MTPELAEILGMFAADGCLQKDYICMWGNIHEDKDYYDKIGNSGGGKMRCPKTDELINFVFFPEKLGKEATSKVREHLKQCIPCKAIVTRYRQDINVLRK